MQAEPQAEHKWLEKLVGDWTIEADCDMGPDKPREKSTGTERGRSIGFWTILEGEMGMPGGGKGTNIFTLGYDPAKKKFVGTFTSSCMANLWVYEGELDAAQKVLSLHVEGPSFTGDGTMAKYIDSIEIVGDDERILRSSFLGPDGQWHNFMTAHYRRVK